MKESKTTKQNKPLTLGDIKKELIPAMERVFATKGDIKEIKQDIKEIRRDSATTKDDLKKFQEDAIKTFASKDDLKEFREDAIKTFASKNDLKEFREDAIKTFASKDDLQKFQDNALEVFATKDDLKAFATKEELFSFQDKTFTGLDSILQKLDILMTEKEVGYFQKKKERQLWAIMISAMKESNILTAKHLKAIQELEVF